MKIAFLTINMTQVGGVERVLSNLSNYMVNKYGYEIEIISVFSNGNREEISFEIDNSIKTYFLGEKIIQYKNIVQKIVSIKEYSKIIKEFLSDKEYDIIISTHDILNSSLALLNKKIKCKTIGCQHANYYEYSKFRRVINFFTYRFLDKVIVLTKKDKELFKRYLKNVNNIPNAISFSSSSKSNCNQKRILAIGRLSKQKGFDYLIESFNMIARDYEEWTLDIIGEGEEFNNLNKKINDLNLKKQVKILPSTKKVKKEYINASIYAMTSRYEGFPMVLLEAMECGLPCVAFELFGTIEIIKNNNDGLIVSKGNIDKFTKSLKYLMDNENIRIEYGRNASKNIKRYNIEYIANEWKNMFEELMC